MTNKAHLVIGMYLKENHYLSKKNALMDVQLNTDKLYRFAMKIAKEEGKELLHHCIAKTDLAKATKDPHTYLYSVMKNEFYNRKSEWNKLKRSQEFEIFNNESIDRYDVNLLYTILMQISNDGLKKEVDIFKEVKFTSNMVQVAKRRNISRYRIRKIIKTIQDEIIRLYPTVQH